MSSQANETVGSDVRGEVGGEVGDEVGGVEDEGGSGGDGKRKWRSGTGGGVDVEADVD